MDTRSMIIGALIVAIAALGYFYYDSQRSQVRINSDGVKIQAN